MIEDSALLSEYCKTGAEDAFTELVRRHVDLVYSVALRHVGYDRHLAEDVSQEVFCALARKASSLRRDVVLGSWLCRSAHFEARNLMKNAKRRRLREEESEKMRRLSEPGIEEIDPDRVRPILDEAIGELGKSDRSAVWLRYFEDRSYTDIGERLQLSENAARMRVKRALDKLGALVARRGITSTTAAIAAAVGGQANTAAPAGMASLLASGALAKVAGGVGVASLLSIFGFMNTTKGVVAMVVIALAMSSGIVMHYRGDPKGESSEDLYVEDSVLAKKSRTNLANTIEVGYGDVEGETSIVGESKDLSEEERFELYKRHIDYLMGEGPLESGQPYVGPATDENMLRQLRPFIIDVFNRRDHRIAYRLFDAIPKKHIYRLHRKGEGGRFETELVKGLDREEVKRILGEVNLRPRTGGRIAHAAIASMSENLPKDATRWAAGLPDAYAGAAVGTIFYEWEKRDPDFGYEALKTLSGLDRSIDLDDPLLVVAVSVRKETEMLLEIQGLIRDERKRADIYKILAGNNTGRSYAERLEWMTMAIEAVPNDATSKFMYEHILREWSERDPEAALNFIESKG